MKTINEHRKEYILDKKLRFEGYGIMTRKEWLDIVRIKGGYVKESTKHRIEFNRTKYNRMSNWNGEQDAYEKKCAEIVPSYRLFEKGGETEGEDTFFEITKTEFDYFNNAALSEDLLTKKYDLSNRIEAGIATEKEIQEDMNNEKEMFAKYFHD